MIAAVQRAHAVWFSALDRWIVPTVLVTAEQLPADWHVVRVGGLVRQVNDRVKVEPDGDYKMLGVKWYGEGAFHRETVRGARMSAGWVTSAVPGAFIYNRLFAWKASFAVVPAEHGDGFVSGEFPQFDPDESKVLADYLYLFFTSPSTLRAVSRDSVGSAAVSRNRFKEASFLEYQIPLPPLGTQREVRCHPGTMVGEYVPFYFCPRSIMLYLLYRGNRQGLAYTGGEHPIVHLVADLERTAAWANANGVRWAFSNRNAGAAYAEFFADFAQLNHVNWEAVRATDFRDPEIKDGKQAESLLYGRFPWRLIEQIGVIDAEVSDRVEAILGANPKNPAVEITREWYY